MSTNLFTLQNKCYILKHKLQHCPPEEYDEITRVIGQIERQIHKLLEQRGQIPLPFPKLEEAKNEE